MQIKKISTTCKGNARGKQRKCQDNDVSILIRVMLESRGGGGLQRLEGFGRLHISQGHAGLQGLQTCEIGDPIGNHGPKEKSDENQLKAKENQMKCNENPMKSMNMQGNPMNIFVNCNEIVCNSNGNTMEIHCSIT